MKFLTAAGIAILLSGPLLVGWVYGINPSDFSSNIVVPIFDGIVLGLIVLGVVSLVLARMPLNPRVAMVIGVAFLLVPVGVFVAGNVSTETGCFNPGISCPATGDIVNGPITVNAGQSNYYQFSIPNGVRDVSVHLQWSSDGKISVYVMNASELIGWQEGQIPEAYYSSAETQGYTSLQLPADNLYYLVFDNAFSTVQKVVQTSSGFSYMCNGICGTIGAPIQQLNPSAPSCVSSNNSEVCSVVLTNLGSVDASPTGVCFESWSADEGPVMSWGTPRQGVFSPRATMAPSSNAAGACTVSGAMAPLGLAITVLIPFAGGYNVMMYGPVSLNAPTCTQSGTQLVCTFDVNNDAELGVVATGCQIQIGDNVTRWTGTLGGTTTLDSAHQGDRFTCSVIGSEPPVGTTVSGTVRFGDGSYAIFSSRWS